MRITLALAAPFPSPQGSQVYVRGMARALARRGHAVTVACYGHGVGEPDDAYAVARIPRVPGYTRVRSGPDLLKPALDVALAALVRRLPADVVHAHNHEALAASLACGRPLVYNAHTLLAEELPTYLRGTATLGALADRLLPRGADVCIAISRRSEAALRARGRPVHLVPPGLDPADFEGVTPRRLGDGPWVVYAGNPDAYQDVGVLLAAMRLLPGVRLLVVTASDWAPPGATVVRTGDWHEARDLLAGADVAALPRAVCGGFPIKLLNYLALGLPVVVAEGSAQGLEGEVPVRGGDPVAFAEGVRRALGGPRPSPPVLRTHGWDVRAEQIERVYAAILRD